MHLIYLEQEHLNEVARVSANRDLALYTKDVSH